MMSEMTNKYNQKYISGLDGFRTLAIVGVTLFHLFPEIISGGYFGVSMFFVLTGYLLAFTNERERRAGKFSLLKYFWKRFKRIYPPLIIMILSTIGVYHFLAPKIIEAVRPEIVSVLLGFNNWWQIFQHADYFTSTDTDSPFTHLWFLGIEIQYYIFWPILFLIYDLFVELDFRKAGIVFIAFLALGFAPLMPILYHYNLDITRLYYGTDTRVYALLFGAVLGLIHGGKEPERIKLKEDSVIVILKYMTFGLCLGLTFISFKILDGQNPLVYQGGMLAITIMFCFMLHMIADNKIELGTFLESGIFHWIGKHSYGIFLWQYPVIFLFKYLEWNKLNFAPLLEITVIMVLTLWADAVSDSLRHRKLPAIGNKMILTQGALFLIVTFIGTIFMGFGCKGLAVSAKTKSDTAELKARIEANKSMIEEQNKKNQLEVTEQIQVQPAQLAENKSQNHSKKKKIDLNGVVFIGDSIMLSAADELMKFLPNCYINAEVARHTYDGMKVIKFFEAQGILGKTVVIALGTNEEINYFERYKQQVENMLEYLGPGRNIFLVNIYDGSGNYEWQKAVNDYIKKLSNERSNVYEIDWYNFISPHPEWLWGDNVHPNIEGSKEYAKFIYENLN